MIGLDHDVHGFVLHFDLGIPQHAAEQGHVERSIHARERRQRGGANELAVVLEHVDDVQAGNRILALDSGDQIVQRGFVRNLGDDLEQSGALAGVLGISGIQQIAHGEACLLRRDHVDDGRFRHIGLVQCLQQRGWRIIAGGGEGPRNTGHCAAIAFRHGAQQIDQPRQDIDIGHRLALFSRRQGGDDRINGVGPKRNQLVQCFLCLGASWITAGFDLGKEPIGTIVGKKTHSVP